MKVEYGTVLDQNAKSLGEARGGHGSVAIPTDWLEHGEIFSHNHPRTGKDAGLLGGTFSKADLDGWVYEPVKTYRATAAEGTYSITKGKNFDQAGTANYIEKIEKECRDRYNKGCSDNSAAYAAGEKTWQQYMADQNKEFNRFLVDRHNQLKSGAKKYGYDYRLERR